MADVPPSVRSITQKCLSRMVPLGERQFRRTVAEYVEHYHRERNHQGLANELIDAVASRFAGRVYQGPRLGGLLNDYARGASRATVLLIPVRHFKIRDIALALKKDVPPTKMEIAQYMYGQPLQFSPGSQTLMSTQGASYSNFEYLMLELAAEKATENAIRYLPA